jgi:spore maturation protein CgeB
MKEVFGDKFKIYNDKYGADFADICESTKIIVSPRPPADDFYWSDRIYKTIANRGFLIHPRLEGLKVEFREKKCFEDYNTFDELVDKIKYWLQPDKFQEKKKIAQHGRNFIENKFNYSNRLREIIDVVK